MSKSLLVLCSSENPNSDYSAKDNQDMLKKLIGPPAKRTVDFLSGEEGQRFPENMPEAKKYDVILLAGCNPQLFFESVLSEYKTGIDLLYDRLNDKGVVVIVESEKNIRGRIKKDKDYYDNYRSTVRVPTLIEMYSEQDRAPGVKGLNHESIKHFIPIFKAKQKYWDHKFREQRTKKKEGEPQYFVYIKQAASSKNADTKIENEVNESIQKAQAAMTEAKEKGAAPANEGVCEKILEEIKKILSKTAAATTIMREIEEVLRGAKITVTIARKGTAKKSNTTTANINSLQGEEACKDKLRIIKIALQDSNHTADERLREIRQQVASGARPNKTAKVSGNSNSNSNSAQTPEADFFDRFEADDPSNRDLASLNGIFKTNLLEDDAVYDKETVEKAAVLKSGAEKTTFSVEEGKAIKQAIIRKNVLKEMEGKPEAEKEAAVQAKIAEEAAKSLEDFRRLYGDFAGGCEEVKISLECMHASGNNSDCFFHSFFGATCEFYRMAKATGKPYTGFVTRFRKEIVPKIIEFFFAEEDDDKPVVTMSAEDLIDELGSPGQFLPDDLYTIITYYYNCAILLVRPEAADGIRVAPLIGENTDATYGISNSAAIHFEPLRIEGQETYKLSDLQAKCLSYTYSQLSGTTASVDIKRFKEMGKVVPLNKPGADGAIAYDEEAMLAAGAGEEPGDVTRVYMGIKGEGYDETKTAQVRRLQEMIQRLTKNYKDRQMYANAKLAPQSQDLEDSIQVLQQGIVDGNKGDADIAAKEGEVGEFVQKLTAEESAVAAKKAKAEAAAAAKKAKAEAKKAAKKGGRRTARKERRGRKTPRA
jgi:hypothetical protein